MAGDGRFFQGHAQGNADVLCAHVRNGDAVLGKKIAHNGAEPFFIQRTPAQGGLQVKQRPARKRQKVAGNVHIIEPPARQIDLQGHPHQAVGAFARALHHLGFLIGGPHHVDPLRRAEMGQACGQ